MPPSPAGSESGSGSGSEWVGVGVGVGLGEGLRLGLGVGAGVSVRPGLADAAAEGLGEAATSAAGRRRATSRLPTEILEQHRLRPELDLADALERFQECGLLRHDVIRAGHPGGGQRADRGHGAIRRVGAVVGVAPRRAADFLTSRKTAVSSVPSSGALTAPGADAIQIDDPRPEQGVVRGGVEDEQDRAIGPADRECVEADVEVARLVEESEVCGLEAAGGVRRRP